MSDAAPASETTILTDAAPAAAAPASAPATDAPAAAPAAAPAVDTLLTADPTAQAADASKTDDAAKADDSKAADAKKDDAKPVGAPEAYEDFKLPEKFEVSESAMGEFKTLAKELNLSQEQAQKLVDFQTSQTKGNTQALVQNLMEGVDKTAKEWADTAKSDAEYGGEKFSENMAHATAALKAFGTDALKAVLNESRLGNHPELIRFMVRAGKAISQDGFVPGRASNAMPKDAASVLYPSSK
jgi:hypothetical protein